MNSSNIPKSIYIIESKVLGMDMKKTTKKILSVAVGGILIGSGLSFATSHMSGNSADTGDDGNLAGSISLDSHQLSDNSISADTDMSEVNSMLIEQMRADLQDTKSVDYNRLGC